MNAKYESAYFKVCELSEGIFALIDKSSNNSSGSNSGIIDLGGLTVVFDTMMNYDASCELRKACFELTGRYPAYVINSHGHMGHVMGNSLFKDDKARIISSSGTRDVLASMKSIAENKKDDCISGMIEIQDMNKELTDLKDISRPEAVIVLADIVFSNEITINGSKRHIILYNMGTVHSPGDVMAFLPCDRILYTGDILFSGSHPWLGSGKPGKLIDILDDILCWEVDYFVPGHGEIASGSEGKLLIQYIKEMIDIVRKKGSFNINDYKSEELSPVFHSWKRENLFRRNIEFMIDSLLRGK